MAEYIDREEAKEWIADWFRAYKRWHPYSKGEDIPTTEVIDVLSTIPAADVQPVKHGKWIAKDNLSYSCSVCRVPQWNISMFCPDCGAKMDGET